mmetsp:Transcript_32098/g.102215  ORF Transcript_32098/g.102215 Transcript_32098/m.102215 type:complete len:305 (-) Transcript_32098:2042-2956(-)
MAVHGRRGAWKRSSPASASSTRKHAPTSSSWASSRPAKIQMLRRCRGDLMSSTACVMSAIFSSSLGCFSNRSFRAECFTYRIVLWLVALAVVLHTALSGTCAQRNSSPALSPGPQSLSRLCLPVSGSFSGRSSCTPPSARMIMVSACSPASNKTSSGLMASMMKSGCSASSSSIPSLKNGQRSRSRAGDMEVRPTSSCSNPWDLDMSWWKIPPARRRSFFDPNSAARPSSSTSTRSIPSRRVRLCVLARTVVPCSLAKLRERVLEAWMSWAESGSSMKRKGVMRARARAMVRRCCCPPGSHEPW